MKAYHVREWNLRYETNVNGRPAKPGDELRNGKLRYVRLKANGLAKGAGYLRLEQVARTPAKLEAAMATWVKILEIAGAQDRARRGWVLNERGEPANLDDLRLCTGFRKATLETGLALLANERVGWLEYIEFPGFLENPRDSAEIRGNPRDPRKSAKSAWHSNCYLNQNEYEYENENENRDTNENENENENGSANSRGNPRRGGKSHGRSIGPAGGLPISRGTSEADIASDPRAASSSSSSSSSSAGRQRPDLKPEVFAQKAAIALRLSPEPRKTLDGNLRCFEALAEHAGTLRESKSFLDNALRKAGEIGQDRHIRNRAACFTQWADAEFAAVGAPRPHKRSSRNPQKPREAACRPP